MSQTNLPTPAASQALPDTNGFLTGETVVADKQPKPVVRYWDLACESLGRSATKDTICWPNASAKCAVHLAATQPP